jgi:hypothetical protein
VQASTRELTKLHAELEEVDELEETDELDKIDEFEGPEVMVAVAEAEAEA